jgi:hypothetical protein
VVNNLKPERRRTKRAGLRGKGFEILTSLIVLIILSSTGRARNFARLLMPSLPSTSSLSSASMRSSLMSRSSRNGLAGAEVPEV